MSFKSEVVESVNINIKFGSTLKTLRKQNKRTQKDVASFLGISTTSYSRYEQDLRQPDFEALAKLAVLFNVDFGQFFTDGIYYMGKAYNEKFEMRLTEGFIARYKEYKELDSTLGLKYRNERRASKLIFRVNSILSGSKTIPGELEYLEEQLKRVFKDYQNSEEMIEMFGDFKKIDNEIVKTLGKIQDSSTKYV